MHRTTGSISLLISGLLLLSSATLAETITFEEPILFPGTVLQQYCNLGVEFLDAQRIFEPGQESPPVATSSPTHALTNHFPGSEFGELSELRIRFSTGQAEVSMNVGMVREEFSSAYGEVELIAYSSDTPGTGTIMSDFASLGTGPAPIDTTLTVSSAQSAIRSVLLRFGQDLGPETFEVIDDLTFSDAGPPCTNDDLFPPSVIIYEPAVDAIVFYDRNLSLDFSVTDDVRMAEVEVEFLDDMGARIDSFFRCGGGRLPCPTSTSFRTRFQTEMPEGTQTIRITATDFSGKSGVADRIVDLRLPGHVFNLWAESMEITQGTQPWLPVNATRRDSTIPTYTYPDFDAVPDSVPLIAGRSTVVRVSAGVEDTDDDNPVGSVRAVLRCFEDPFFTIPCAGSTSLIFPESRPPDSKEQIAVDPSDDLETKRRDLSKTWNFVLPREWIDRPPTIPGGNAFSINLEAKVSAAFSLPECAACDDAVNRIRTRLVEFRTVPGFSDSLVHQVRVERRAPTTGASHTPSDEDLQPFIDFLRKTFPVDETTVSSFVGVVTSDHEDENGDVICDNTAARNAFPRNGDRECCSDGYRLVSSFMGGDLDGDGDADCGNGGIGAADGFAKTLLPTGMSTTAQELGHANGVQAAAPRGMLWHAGPPPGHGSECFGDCEGTDDCTLPDDVRDCNCNGIDDVLDIDNGTSLDDNGNGIPDECQCRQDSDCGVGPGICKPTCERDWPWDHGTIGAFGFDILDFEVMPSDQLECRTPGTCDNGVDDDSDGLVDEDCSVWLGNNDLMNHPHDFMSYGGCDTWVSPRTWVRLYNGFTGSHLPFEPTPRSAGRGAIAASLSIGGVEDASGSWSLSHAFELDELPATSEEGVGVYRLELRDAFGQAVAARNFDLPQLSGSGDHGAASAFRTVLPLPAGVQSIVLLHDGDLLAERQRSASAPSLTLLSPNAAGFSGPPSSPPVAVWTAGDVDGDSLRFMVQYARTAGVAWRTLASDVVLTTLPARVEELEGSSDARVRVLASDGLNTSSAVSAAFVVDGHPPRVEILSPGDGSTLLPGERRVARGYAVDLEDGVIDSLDLAWSSDADGFLGGGREVDLAALSSGSHRITLQALDSEAMAGVAWIDVVVEPRFNGQPVADAGPDATAATVASLDGTGSLDPDGDPLSYHWSLRSQPPGANAQFSDDKSTQPTLQTTVPGIYEVDLVVDDGVMESWVDTVTLEFCTDQDQDGVCADLVVEGLDCDDTDPLVYPDAPEINDGLDQQCPGDQGFGLIDEVSGTALMGPGNYNIVGPPQILWSPQAGAQLYRVIRSDRPDFVGACTVVTTADAFWVDQETPGPGKTFHYLVQALEPNAGSWGVTSAGTARAPACDNVINELVFRDDNFDELPADALSNWFQSFQTVSGDYILFEIGESNRGDPIWTAQRCMNRADWYASNYLTHAGSGATISSNVTSKWWRYSWEGANWNGPMIFGQPNRYGTNCFESTSWCADDGLGGLATFAVRPMAGGLCESYINTLGGCGNPRWRLKIRVAPRRLSACGF